MRLKINFRGQSFVIVLLILLLIPTFWRLLRPGIFSMQDMHVFRLFEYDKCIKDLQIPCRWSPDVSFGYGQPLFNFYGQLSYAVAEIFRSLGFSLLDSLKGAYILSLVLSGVGMYFLGKQLWKNKAAAFICAMVYVYAPYRAVDVFVRGALPESMAFVFFPPIVYFFNQYVATKKVTSLLLFGIFFAGLILNHNLSVLMFLFFFIPWAIFVFFKEKAWRLLPSFLGIGLLVFGLTAFYLIPLYSENNLVSLQKTILGYFDYHNHFVTLKQLLISRYWGYGASLWGDDDRLSLSVGHVQWIVPLVITGGIILTRSFKKYLSFFVLLGIGWMILLLTHNKSTAFWEFFSPMAYIQFSWRFLGMAVFSFALSAGAIITLSNKFWPKFLSVAIIIAALLALNIPFFFEDLWFSINDHDQFSGPKYQQLEGFGSTDYWPIYGKDFPVHPAPKMPIFVEGNGVGEQIDKLSNQATYNIEVQSQTSEVQFPIAYFPGWEASGSQGKLSIYPSGDFGLITTSIPQGSSQVTLKFQNTETRSISNMISAGTLILLTIILVKLRFRK